MVKLIEKMMSMVMVLSVIAMAGLIDAVQKPIDWLPVLNCLIVFGVSCGARWLIADTARKEGEDK